MIFHFPILIKANLGVAPASMTSMIQRLDAEGHLVHERYCGGTRDQGPVSGCKKTDEVCGILRTLEKVKLRKR